MDQAAPAPAVALDEATRRVPVPQSPGRKEREQSIDGALSTHPKGSWASVVVGNKRLEDGLRFENDSAREEGPDVKLDDEVWAEGINDWRTTLIGYVFGLTPSLYTMKNYVRKRWGDERVISVQEQRREVFIYYFESKADMDDILEKGTWPFDNRPLILQAWQPTMDLNLNSAKMIPVWVKLPI